MRTGNLLKAPRGKKPTTINIIAYKALLSACGRAPKSRTELQEITGLANSTVSRWVKILSTGKDKVLYISTWKRFSDRGQWIACYSLGYGMADTLKPRRQTNAEYCQNYRNKRSTFIIPTSEGIKHVRI
jgi:hypothetical protein